MRTLSREKIGRVLVIVLALISWSAIAMAEDDSGDAKAGKSASEWGAVVFDVSVLRPLGAIQTAVGTALFALAGPLSIPSEGVGEAWDIFVQVPYEDTFQRPLGRF